MSVQHNLEKKLTGFLLYAGGNFIQIIDGKQVGVEATFSVNTRALTKQHSQLGLFDKKSSTSAYLV
ncbi:MAG: hypothetical protein HOO92_16055 [Methylococcaceae bacterium]|nr:hypothetical protein [Methylococcaceae bacterium]